MSEPRGFVGLRRGDPAPWFTQRATGHDRFTLDAVAGRYLVLCFYGSSADPQAKAALAAVERNRAVFDDAQASFFGVSLDPLDESEGRVAASVPGVRHFFDGDGTISRSYGSIARDAILAGSVQIRRFWLALDPTMRIMARFDFRPDGSDADAAFDFVRSLPAPGRFAGVSLQAPVLFLPNVLEPELCRKLIAYYEETGGEESGFMRQVEGKTIPVHDHAFKRRRDAEIRDDGLKLELQNRLHRRVSPEIRKVHQFDVSRMERYIVACYSAEDGGHFRAHRDNTTSGTAHRRFAVSINLNADFDGGEVSFPEYGPRSFKPPAGGAVVFSCSILHGVSKVTRGVRYAFLPFLYDEAAAKLRETNAASLANSSYRADRR